MNNTVLSKETKKELKLLVKKNETLKNKLKILKKNWVFSIMNYNLYEDGIVKKYKNRIKKNNKRIYEIIKTL
jgi:hypothetical protein